MLHAHYCTMWKIHSHSLKTNKRKFVLKYKIRVEIEQKRNIVKKKSSFIFCGPSDERAGFSMYEKILVVDCKKEREENCESGRGGRKGKRENRKKRIE